MTRCNSARYVEVGIAFTHPQSALDVQQAAHRKANQKDTTHTYETPKHTRG